MLSKKTLTSLVPAELGCRRRISMIDLTGGQTQIEPMKWERSPDFIGSVV